MSQVFATRVVARAERTPEVCELCLERVSGVFTDLSPGGHLDVHVGGDQVRQYSLTDWSADGARVSIAVKREPDGRGGSLAMHALRVGDELLVAGPRNHFQLVDDDRPRLLLAGGIGITPIYAMARSLRAGGQAFDLHHMVRERALAVFGNELEALALGDAYRLHSDAEEGIPDFMSLIGRYPSDVRIYVCGPEVMLNAVQKASEELGVGSVHFERFAAVPHAAEEPRSFEVVLGSTGAAFEVGPEESILEVLRTNGHDVEWGCSEGVCGTCITDVLEGEIEHLDSVLTDDEHAAGDCVCICVSRARGDRLVLDL